MSAAGNKQKIGLYGGTFDPVHRGHLAIAEQVLARYRLDTLLIIPAARPPHKEQPQASYAQRVAMLEVALTGMDRVSLSLIESERDVPSYTYDTCLELRQRLGPQDFYLIIGADSFCELHLWYRYRELLELLDLLVAARPAFPFRQLAEEVRRLPGPYSYDEHCRLWLGPGGRRIHYFPETREPVSSSEVRAKLRAGQPVDHLLPPAVTRYIQQQHLYARASSASISDMLSKP